MKNQPEKTPMPAFLNPPKRDDLFQFLREISKKHGVRVEHPYLPGDSPFTVYSVEEDSLGTDHYD